MTKRKIEQHLTKLQADQIIDGFAPISRAEPARFYVMLFVKAKDYRKDMAKGIVESISEIFPNLDIGVATIGRSR